MKAKFNSLTKVLCYRAIKINIFPDVCFLYVPSSHINHDPAEPGYVLPANSVYPDQLASEEANWFWLPLFVSEYVHLYLQPGSINLIDWKLEVGVEP